MSMKSLLLGLAQTRILIRILKAAENEPPFIAQELASAEVMTKAWKPVYKKLKSRLSDVIDFRNLEYNEDPFDIDHLSDDEIIQLVEEGWISAEDPVVKNMGIAFDNGHPGTDEDEKGRGEVLAALGLFTGYYYKRHLHNNVKPTVERLLIEMREGKIGKDKRPDVIRRIQREIESGNYFTGLSNVHTSRAYHFGFLHWCEAQQITTYEWQGYPDDRMCAICRELHGTHFDVSITVGMMSDYLLSKSAEEAEKVFPWPRAKEIKEMSREALRASPYRLPPIHNNCYAEGTEVLTAQGWKDFRDVTESDIFLSRKRDGELVWEKAKRKIGYHYRHGLYHLHNSECDLCVTMNHEQPYVSNNKYFHEPIANMLQKHDWHIPSSFYGLDVDINPGSASSYDTTVDRVDHEGTVYCVELEGTHVLCVRRNGKVAFSGNCRCWVVPVGTRIQR